MMKRFIKGITISLPVILFSFSGTALAQDPIFNPTGLAKSTDPNAEILIIITYLLGIAFTLAVTGLLVGGFLYITSAGMEDRAERAKNIIQYSITGLVVIILAYVIVSTVNTVFNK